MTPRTPEDATATRKLADELFVSGRFRQAHAQYAQLERPTCTNPALQLNLVRLALLDDRPREALRRLNPILEVQPQLPGALALAAEGHYRLGEFQTAATLYRQVGRAALADFLFAFEGRVPWRLSGARQAKLSWIASEPLPVVGVQCGSHVLHLVIDTGASELVLDRTVAQSLGLALSESESAGFRGGRSADVQHGRLPELELNGIHVHDLPVHVAALRHAVWSCFPQLEIDGVLGLGAFARLEVALDYRSRQMRLRTPETDEGEPVGAPMYLTPERQLLTEARVNGTLPTLVLVDTGMSGAAFAAPPSTMQAARLTLPEIDPVSTYSGGTVAGMPFVLPELEAGGCRRENVNALLLPRFPLERQYGFRIGGLLAHDFFRGKCLTLQFDRMRMLIE